MHRAPTCRCGDARFRKCRCRAAWAPPLIGGLRNIGNDPDAFARLQSARRAFVEFAARPVVKADDDPITRGELQSHCAALARKDAIDRVGKSRLFAVFAAVMRIARHSKAIEIRSRAGAARVFPPIDAAHRFDRTATVTVKSNPGGYSRREGAGQPALSDSARGTFHCARCAPSTAI